MHQTKELDDFWLDEGAKHVLDVAETYARRYHARVVSAEHLLLALIEHFEASGDAGAISVLEDYEITVGCIEGDLHGMKCLLSKPSESRRASFILLKRRKSSIEGVGEELLRVLRNAASEPADKYSQPQRPIGVRDLLLGILLLQDCSAAKLLTAYGLNHHELRHRLNLLKPAA